MTTFCTFLSDITRHAIQSQEVRVVFTSFDIISLPTTNPHIVGLINVYDDIYTAISLYPQIQRTNKYCIILKNLTFAILCEEVDLIDGSQTQPASKRQESCPSYVISSIEHSNKGMISIIDLQKLQALIQRSDTQ
jgi:chemotaxis signal transduction protein